LKEGAGQVRAFGSSLCAILPSGGVELYKERLVVVAGGAVKVLLGAFFGVATCAFSKPACQPHCH